MSDKKQKSIIKDTGKKLIVYDADTGEVLKIKKKDVVTQRPSSSAEPIIKKHSRKRPKDVLL